MSNTILYQFFHLYYVIYLKESAFQVPVCHINTVIKYINYSHKVIRSEGCKVTSDCLNFSEVLLTVTH